MDGTTRWINGWMDNGTVEHQNEWMEQIDGMDGWMDGWMDEYGHHYPQSC